MKRLLSVAALLSLACLAFAEGIEASNNLEVQGFYGFPNRGAVDSSGFVPIAYGTVGGAAGQRSVGSSWGSAGAKAIFSRDYTMPVLTGDGALTKDNNLDIGLASELSPVSLTAKLEATLTPIAFLKFAAGASGGTGWDIGFIGLGTDAGGIDKSENFGGLVYRAWASGTFQFDLAALMPGDWNHVVILASPKVEYQGYTGASATTPWIWEADDGRNYNGLKLKGSYVLAYQMPLQVSMAGVLVEPERYLSYQGYDSETMASGGWGSDFTTWAISPLVNIALSKDASIAILPQIKSGIKWTSATTLAQDFTKRVFESTYWYFNRIAFDFNLKL